MFLLEWEWQIIQNYGKLGLSLGSGLYTLSGTGQVSDDTTETLEKFRLYVLPNTLSLIYRLDYWSNQWLIPYVGAGVTAFSLFEVANDSKELSTHTSYANTTAGGLAINLSNFNQVNASELDNDYGINAMHLTLEIRQFTSTDKNYNVSGTLASAGLLVEY